MSQQLQQTQQQTQKHYPKIINISTDPNNQEVYLKTFLIDDSSNQNFWQIPDTALKKYATGFIGRPLIKHPSGKHPDYIKEGVIEHSRTFIQDVLNHQEQYKIGEIIDVKQENWKDDPTPSKKPWFAYIKLTNPEAISTIKSGASSMFVSPQIIDLDMAAPGEQTNNFVPIHLAIVNEPAYGNRANLKGVCTGGPKPCINALKEAAQQLVNVIDNSSFLKNSVNDNYTLSNQNNTLDHNYPQGNNGLQEVANAVSNPNIQYNQTTPQVLSQKTQTQEIGADGSLVTKTEDKKPKQKTANEVPLANPNPNNIPVQTPQPNQVPQGGQVPAVNTIEQQAPVAPKIDQTFQLPQELTDALKSMQDMRKELDDIKKFKQTAEEKQLKEASEAQRQTIETALQPVVTDPNALQQLTDFYVSLNVTDEQLQQLLELHTKGNFTPKDSNPQTAPAAPAPKATTSKKPNFVKGAALIMRNDNTSNVARYGALTSERFINGFFGDTDLSNL